MCMESDLTVLEKAGFAGYACRVVYQQDAWCVQDTLPASRRHCCRLGVSALEQVKSWRSAYEQGCPAPKAAQSVVEAPWREAAELSL